MWCHGPHAERAEQGAGNHHHGAEKRQLEGKLTTGAKALSQRETKRSRLEFASHKRSAEEDTSQNRQDSDAGEFSEHPGAGVDLVEQRVAQPQPAGQAAMPQIFAVSKVRLNARDDEPQREGGEYDQQTSHR